MKARSGKGHDTHKIRITTMSFRHNLRIVLNSTLSSSAYIISQDNENYNGIITK